MSTCKFDIRYNYHQPVRVVLVGLDNSGKGTLLRNLGIKAAHNCQIPEVVLNCSRFRMYLLKGHHRAKPLFEGNYLDWADGAMFVVDIKDPDRFDEAAYEVVRLRFQMPQIPIALICNKYDGPQDEKTLQKWREKLQMAIVKRLCFQDINVPYSYSEVNSEMNTTNQDLKTSTTSLNTQIPTSTPSSTKTMQIIHTMSTTASQNSLELRLLNLPQDIILREIFTNYVSDLDLIVISATCKSLRNFCNSAPLCLRKQNFFNLVDTWKKLGNFSTFEGNFAGDKTKKSPAVEALLWINTICTKKRSIIYQMFARLKFY